MDPGCAHLTEDRVYDAVCWCDPTVNADAVAPYTATFLLHYRAAAAGARDGDNALAGAWSRMSAALRCPARERRRIKHLVALGLGVFDAAAADRLLCL